MKRVWKNYRIGKSGGQHYWINLSKNYDSLGWFAKQTKYKYRTKIGAGYEGKELKEPISKEEIAREIQKLTPKEAKDIKRVILSEEKEFKKGKSAISKTPGFVSPLSKRDIYLMKEPLEKAKELGISPFEILHHEIGHIKTLPAFQQEKRRYKEKLDKLDIGGKKEMLTKFDEESERLAESYRQKRFKEK